MYLPYVRKYFYQFWLPHSPPGESYVTTLTRDAAQTLTRDMTSTQPPKLVSTMSITGLPVELVCRIFVQHRENHPQDYNHSCLSPLLSVDKRTSAIASQVLYEHTSFRDANEVTAPPAFLHRSARISALLNGGGPFVRTLYIGDPLSCDALLPARFTMSGLHTVSLC